MTSDTPDICCFQRIPRLRWARDDNTEDHHRNCKPCSRWQCLIIWLV